MEAKRPLPQKAQTFTDSLQRKWTINIDLGARNRVRSLVAFDIFDVDNPAELMRLSDDPVLMVDVLYALLKPQCDKLNLDDMSFAEGMDGYAIASGYECYEAALIVFFQQAAPTKGRVLVGRIEKMRSVLPRVEEMAIQQLDSEEMDQAITAKLQEADDDIRSELVSMSQGKRAS